MIPEPLRILRPDVAREALQLLAEHGDDAKVLAGGHSLIPLMKLRLAAPGCPGRHRPHRRASKASSERRRRPASAR